MSADKSNAASLADRLERPGYDAQKERDTTAAAAELRRLDAVNRELLEALSDAEDSLAYVERVMPGKVGYGVRQERIAKARAAIAKATDV